MPIFDESDYRTIIKAMFATKAKFGHGQASRLARAIGANTTLVSQVFAGKRNLTEEQAVKTATFLSFNSKEKYYFLLLVQMSRADDEGVRELLAAQIRKLQDESKSIQGRIAPKAQLSADQQAIYYSNWLYSAVHTLVSIPGHSDALSISQELGFPIETIHPVLDDLLEMGLLVSTSEDLKSGPNTTYLPPGSPFIARHHQNWRQISAYEIHKRTPTDFFFTAPMSISKSDFKIVRAELTEFLSKLYKIVGQTKPEEMASLNIDFFTLKGSSRRSR